MSDFANEPVEEHTFALVHRGAIDLPTSRFVKVERMTQRNHRLRTVPGERRELLVEGDLDRLFHEVKVSRASGDVESGKVRADTFGGHKLKLPIEFYASFDQSDDVTWLVRPPGVSRYREPADGRPEPAVDLLGETEYSATDYFGNEASDASFYATAAILFDVPPKSARKRVAGD